MCLYVIESMLRRVKGFIYATPTLERDPFVGGAGIVNDPFRSRVVLCLLGVNPLPAPGNSVGAVHGRRGTPGLTGDAPEVPW